MVTITPEVRTMSSVSSRGNSMSPSSPRRARTVSVIGSGSETGRVPAVRTRIRSPASRRVTAAAIWDRPVLCTQTNSTSRGEPCVTSVMAASRSVASQAVRAGSWADDRTCSTSAA